jgi:hypothetical protein
MRQILAEAAESTLAEAAETNSLLPQLHKLHRLAKYKSASLTGKFKVAVSQDKYPSRLCDRCLSR